MTHFLRQGDLTDVRYSQRHAVVTARVDHAASVLVLDEGGIGVAKDGIPFAALHERFKLVDMDGNEIARQKGRVRVVSTCTFDPYHMVADVAEECWNRWNRYR